MRCQIALAATLCCLWTASAQAQSKGDAKPSRISVRMLETNAVFSGQLVELDADAVTLMIDGVPVEMTLTKVSTIHTAPDSVLNGTIIGGLIAGIYCTLVCGQGLDSSESRWPTTLKMAGFGAFIGAIVDTSKTDQRLIYPAPPSSAARSRGLSLTIRF